MSGTTTHGELEPFPVVTWVNHDRGQPYLPSRHISQGRATPENHWTTRRPASRDADSSGSVVDAGFDSEHRTGRVKQNALGIGPQDQLADRGTPAKSDHDEVRVDFIGDLDQVL